MFRYGISCSLEPQPARQPAVLRGEIGYLAKTAGSIGYDGIELFIRNPGRLNAGELLRAAGDQNIKYCALATGMEYTKNGLSLISDSSQTRRDAVSRLKEHIELASKLGCCVIVGIMRANIPDFDKYDLYEGRLTQALCELSDYAGGLGVMIVVESIMRYINNYLNAAPETAAYLRRLNRGNVRLHIDTHSMTIEDADLAQSVLASRDMLEYVHFSDSNRGYPGAGNIDFAPVMNALMEVGYQDYITAECVPLPDGEQCAKRALACMKALETLVAIKRAPFDARL